MRVEWAHNEQISYGVVQNIEKKKTTTHEYA